MTKINHLARRIALTASVAVVAAMAGTVSLKTALADNEDGQGHGRWKHHGNSGGDDGGDNGDESQGYYYAPPLVYYPPPPVYYYPPPPPVYYAPAPALGLQLNIPLR